MKNLVIAVLMLFVTSCLSLNPATSNYPVTGDVLKAWVDGIPYVIIDESQHYRSIEKEGKGIPGLWFDVDKKGNWFVLQNVQTTGGAGLDTPPTPTAKFAALSSISYVERPFRK